MLPGRPEEGPRDWRGGEPAGSPPNLEMVGRPDLTVANKNSSHVSVLLDTG